MCDLGYLKLGICVIWDMCDLGYLYLNLGICVI
jgi:hypothetical protein